MEFTQIILFKSLHTPWFIISLLPFVMFCMFYMSPSGVPSCKSVEICCVEKLKCAEYAGKSKNIQL